MATTMQAQPCPRCPQKQTSVPSSRYVSMGHKRTSLEPCKSRNLLALRPLRSLLRVLLQHQHVEPVNEDAVTAAEIALRLFPCKSGCAECNTGLKNCLFHVLDGIEEDRRVELAGNAEFSRQVERRDNHVVNALDLADVFDVVDGVLRLDQEAAHRLRPTLG